MEILHKDRIVEDGGIKNKNAAKVGYPASRF